MTAGEACIILTAELMISNTYIGAGFGPDSVAEELHYMDAQYVFSQKRARLVTPVRYRCNPMC
jgi:hypothetical protein